MAKTLNIVISFFLVPCLVADPALAHGLSMNESQPVSVSLQYRMKLEAFALRWVGGTRSTGTGSWFWRRGAAECFPPADVNRPLRILTVTASNMTAIGGSERSIRDLSLAILKAEANTSMQWLYRIYPKPLSDELPASGVTHSTVMTTFSWLRSSFSPTFGWRFLQEILHMPNRPDVIHLHSPHHLSSHVASRIAGWLLNVPVVVTIRVPLLLQWNQPLSWYQKITGYLLSFGAAAVTSVSHHAAEALGHPADLVAHGIDTAFFDPSLGDGEAFRRRPELSGIPSNSPIIFYPARFTAQKGHRDLMKMIALLENDPTRPYLVAMGADMHSDILKALRQSNPNLADRIRLLPPAGLESVRDGYAACNLVCFPTYRDALPRIVMEAQAMGKPVVAYDTGGVPEAMLGGETGFLVPVGDVAAMASRVSFLLAHPEAGEAMGQAGRLFVVTHFRLEHLPERYLALYRKLRRQREDPGMARHSYGPEFQDILTQLGLINVLLPENVDIANPILSNAEPERKRLIDDCNETIDQWVTRRTHRVGSNVPFMGNELAGLIQLLEDRHGPAIETFFRDLQDPGVENRISVSLGAKLGQPSITLRAWRPRERSSRIHNHGRSVAVYHVMKGSLQGNRFVRNKNGRFQKITQTHAAGSTFILSPSELHQVSSASDIHETAISIHAYAPQLTLMNQYDEINGKLVFTGHWKDDEVIHRFSTGRDAHEKLSVLIQESALQDWDQDEARFPGYRRNAFALTFLFAVLEHLGISRRELLERGYSLDTLNWCYLQLPMRSEEIFQAIQAASLEALQCIALGQPVPRLREILRHADQDTLPPLWVLKQMWAKSAKAEPTAVAVTHSVTVLGISGYDLRNIWGGLEGLTKLTNELLVQEVPIDIQVLWLAGKTYQPQVFRGQQGTVTEHPILKWTRLHARFPEILAARDLYREGRKILLEAKNQGQECLIHIYTPFPPSAVIAAWLLSLRFSIPRVLTSHHAGVLFPTYSSFYRLFRFLVPFFALGSYITGVSHAATHYFFGRPTMVASGIDVNFFFRSQAHPERFIEKYSSDEYAASMGPNLKGRVSQDALLLFDPSRLRPEKGQQDLPMVAERLRELHESGGPYTQIVLMGSVQNKVFVADLWKEITARGLQEYLCILPTSTSEDIRDGYAASILELHPSRTEALPLILLEGSAMEIPVVSYRVNGIPEAVQDGITGYLVPPGDVEALRDRVIDLVLDAGLRYRMGVAGRAFVTSQYSIESLVQQWIQLYSEIAQRARAGRWLSFIGTIQTVKPMKLPGLIEVDTRDSTDRVRAASA